MTIKETEKVAPIRIKDAETNHTYILDFSRETVQFAEDRGFDWDLVGTKPGTLIPLIWFCAFRRYDRRISYEKTTQMLEDLGGMRTDWLRRLRALYDQSMASLIADPDKEESEEDAKNAKLTVSLD